MWVLDKLRGLFQRGRALVWPVQSRSSSNRSQAKMSRVEGKGYYARTLTEAERIAREEVDRFLEELAKELEQ